MNEFEWRRQLRDLRQPMAPPPQLWQRIDDALDRVPATAPVQLTRVPSIAPRRRRPLHWLSAACAATLVLLAGTLAWRMHDGHRMQPLPAGQPLAQQVIRSAGWKPSDPRLSGAAVELDAAQSELVLALRQAPHSAALQRLLTLTEQQQSRLHRMDHEAS